MAIAQLLTIAMVTGQDVGLMRKLVQKHVKVFPTIYKEWLGKECLDALSTQTHDKIVSLRAIVGKARTR